MQTEQQQALTPMQVAETLVKLERALDRAEDVVDELKKQIATQKERLLAHIEAGEFPSSSRVDGASVHISTQVWASPANKDHEALTAVLDELGLEELKPSTVNSQRLSAYVREHLADDDTLDLEARLQTLDPRLRERLKVSEVVQVKVTGA